MSFKFTKLGRIIQANPDYYWMSTFAGPSFARREGSSDFYTIYVTGRDNNNRSRIGTVRLNIKDPSKLDISQEPILDLGSLNSFDENGVSYPYIEEFKSQSYMTYVGWVATQTSRFQNHMGMAYEDDAKFSRLSKAPILPRSDLEYCGTGSSCIIAEGDTLRMWYTSFLRWEIEEYDGTAKHFYVIRYAESDNTIDWKRSEHICINYKNDKEFAISRPSVLKVGDKYHMWFAYRGKQYRIGYAVSDDGINWSREDEKVGITVSEGQSWDSEAVTYPHVFKHDDDIYMIYNGNEYGKTGLGLAIMEGSLDE